MQLLRQSFGKAGVKQILLSNNL